MEGAEGWHSLTELTGFDVKEKASILEGVSAALGVEIEFPNRYDILDPETQNRIFFAAEENSCTKRCMQTAGCRDCAPWQVDILYTGGSSPEKFLTVKRPCTWTCCCFNTPFAHVEDNTGLEVGKFSNPCSCCGSMKFGLHSKEGAPILDIDGGCCQWGLCCPLPCGPCSRVTFYIKEAGTEKIAGTIEKKVPGCCKWFFAPDVDNYHVKLEDKNMDIKMKALLMAFTIFLDFRYFNDNSQDTPPEERAWGAATELME